MTLVRTLIFSTAIGLVLLCGLGVASAQLVGVSPQTLSFVYQIGGLNPAAQSIFLTGDLPTQFTVTISGAPWLTVSPTTGLTPSTLTATVLAPANATPGTLSGSIIIGPPGSIDASRTVVAVSLQVLAPAQGNLIVNPDSIAVAYQVGGPIPTSAAFSVTSSGNPEAFNLSTSASWLSVFANSYVTPATVYVNITPGPGMGPGVYTGFVNVNPNFNGGRARQVTVTLRISAGGSLTATPSYLSFNYQPQGQFPQSQSLNIVNSAGGAVPYVVSAVTTSGGAWLASFQTSVNTPSTVVVSASPAGLGPGTYYGTVTINATTGGVTATQIPVTLTVFNSSQLVADPNSLSFDYQSGGPAPAAQYLSVRSTGSPVTFSVTVQGPAFVSASISLGTTPTGFSVNARPPSTTPSGTYTASVTLTPQSGGGNPITIPVSIRVTSPNYLTVGRSSVSIDSSVGGGNPAPVIVPVTSSGGSLRFEAVAATAGFSSWLSVSQSSLYTPASLTISVSPASLAVGSYSGTVVVNSEGASNGQQFIAVTLTVTDSAAFVASPFGLVFSYQATKDQPAPQVFSVSSPSAAVLFTTSAETTSGGGWLTVVGHGTTPATVVAAVNAAGLDPGTYSGRILINSNDGSVPVLEAPVVLNVSAVPVFLPAVNQVSFQYETNGPAPAPQKVTINLNNSGSSVFYPTVATADGGAWLAVSPDVGVTSSDLTLSVNPTGLAPGLYYGLVGVNDPGGHTPSSFVPVSLQVSSGPILAVAAQSIWLSAPAGSGGKATQTINVLGIGPPSSFQVTTSGGDWLRADPANARTDALVTVTVSAENLGAGLYLGLVTIEIPGVPNSQQMVPVVFTVSP